jgi:hypothetical protein
MLLLVCVDGYAVGVEDVAPDFNTSNLKGNHISYSGQSENVNNFETHFIII